MTAYLLSFMLIRRGCFGILRLSRTLLKTAKHHKTQQNVETTEYAGTLIHPATRPATHPATRRDTPGRAAKNKAFRKFCLHV